MTHIQDEDGLSIDVQVNLRAFFDNSYKNQDQVLCYLTPYNNNQLYQSNHQ